MSTDFSHPKVLEPHLFRFLGRRQHASTAFPRTLHERHRDRASGRRGPILMRKPTALDFFLGPRGPGPEHTSTDLHQERHFRENRKKSNLEARKIAGAGRVCGNSITDILQQGVDLEAARLQMLLLPPSSRWNVAFLFLFLFLAAPLPATPWAFAPPIKVNTEIPTPTPPPGLIKIPRGFPSEGATGSARDAHTDGRRTLRSTRTDGLLQALLSSESSVWCRRMGDWPSPRHAANRLCAAQAKGQGGGGGGGLAGSGQQQAQVPADGDAKRILFQKLQRFHCPSSFSPTAHACLDGWMDGWMDGWVGGWMDGWMDG